MPLPFPLSHYLKIVCSLIATPNVSIAFFVNSYLTSFSSSGGRFGSPVGCGIAIEG